MIRSRPELLALEPTLREVLRSLPNGTPAHLVVAHVAASPPSAASATLLFPRWAEDACGGELTRGDRIALLVAQAQLLAWGVVRDRLADGAPGGAAGAAHLLPLLFDAQQRLWRLFGAAHPFWTDYRRIIRQQVAADRWEMEADPATPFGPALVRRLGRKAALLRWPAWAVARRLGRPALAARLDATFDELLAALQLLDDVTDVYEDAASGQINSVLAAGGRPSEPGEIALNARVLRGLPVVFAAARARLRRLARVGGGLGGFARTILVALERDERRVLQAAQRRAVAGVLGGLVRSGSARPDASS